MQKTIHRCSLIGLLALMLAAFLSCSPFLGQASASAHTAQAQMQVAPPARSTSRGKVIVVSIAQQRMYAYQHGRVVFSALVLTGRAALPTPYGTYHVFKKLSPTIFRSPFPRRSSYWYPPTYISYALEFREPGYFLHDSWWHTVYGPGTNRHHYDPRYGWQEGSHGCVSMPLYAARWLYHWAPLGTPVHIVR